MKNIFWVVEVCDDKKTWRYPAMYTTRKHARHMRKLALRGWEYARIVKFVRAA